MNDLKSSSSSYNTYRNDDLFSDKIFQIVLQFTALCIFAVALVIEYKENFSFFKNTKVQIINSILILLIVIFVDEITGFILAISLLVLYFKLYINYKNKNLKPTSDNIELYENNDEGDLNTNIDPGKKISQRPYITELDLLNAQNNIFDENNLIKNVSIFQNKIEDSYTPSIKNAYDKNDIESRYANFAKDSTTI